MSFAESFEDLKVWQRARTLTNAIYNTMRACKDYAFRDQIQRAATSVMNNISESFERRTKKDFAHFLDLAKGSAGEVRSMLYLGENRSEAEIGRLRDQLIPERSGDRSLTRPTDTEAW
jgi:four helix bundle protein